MIQEHKRLGKMMGNEMNAAYLRSELMLCMEVASEGSKEKHIVFARSQNWPTSIDFKKLPNRIVLMKDELTKLFTDRKAQVDTIVHQQLLENLIEQNLGSTLQKLAKVKIVPLAVHEYARPG